MTTPVARALSETFGREARDRGADTLIPTEQGALAALESFYFAFNQRSIAVFDRVWAPDAQISLANPLGGILRGTEDIRALYRRIFDGPARVWVKLHDVLAYHLESTAVFSGRERGAFSRGAVTVPLAIRTTRVFQHLGPELGWRQVHHHGSIDDADLLTNYQSAVQGG